MKFSLIFLIFIFGIVVGRWVIPQSEKKKTSVESVVNTGLSANGTSEKALAETEISPNPSSLNSSSGNLGEVNPNFKRSDSTARDKQVNDLFGSLLKANQKANAEEQNRLFAEMELLGPKHEKVFQAKALFLQDDENWDGAHEVLKECVAFIPNSVYCLRRLANIRSSTNEDKLDYGSRCLEIAKNDPLCTVDVAMALYSKGEYAKAKEYFERALNLPSGSEGYHKEYVLFQYALTLESLQLFLKAKAALTEACRLKMKLACEKLKY